MTSVSPGTGNVMVLLTARMELMNLPAVHHVFAVLVNFKFLFSKLNRFKDGRLPLSPKLGGKSFVCLLMNHFRSCFVGFRLLHGLVRENEFKPPIYFLKIGFQ